METARICSKYHRSTFTLVVGENNSRVMGCTPGTEVPWTLLFLQRGHDLAFGITVEGEAFYNL